MKDDSETAATSADSAKNDDSAYEDSKEEAEEDEKRLKAARELLAAIQEKRAQLQEHMGASLDDRYRSRPEVIDVVDPTPKS